MHPVPISRSRVPSAARQWRLARADRAHWGPKREGQKKLGSRRRLRDRALCLSKRRPGPSSLTTSAPPLPPCLSLSPEPKTPQARRAAVVRISALAQRAEYIWFDGLEGAPEKVRCFVFSFFSPLFPFERERGKKTGKKKKRGPKIPTLARSKRKRKKKTPPHPPKPKPQGTVFNEMRSKTKVIQKPVTSGNPKDFPDWSFDGSSTGQAEGNNSDCILNPVAVYPDPVRGGQDVLVMCEVLNPDSTPHSTNTRAALAALIDAAVRFFLSPETFLLDRGFFGGFSPLSSLTFCPSPPLPPFLFLFSTPPLSPRQVVAEAPLYGFEQEYTMLTNSGNVYGWPQGGYPAPQGPFYCGVGSTSVYGRPLAEAHMVSGGGRGRGRGREGGGPRRAVAFVSSLVSFSLADRRCLVRTPKPQKTGKKPK